MTHPEETIPNHRDGTDVTVEDYVDFSNAEQAKSFFSIAKKRLLNVNDWGKIAGALSAGFQLTDEKGKEINATPEKGNYFKINIPAPGIISGEGFDWVKVEEVREEADEMSESIAMRVRPCSSPVNDNEDVAHFYTEEATSTFIVKREGEKVLAGVYGRNEKPNVKTDNLLDKARNALVGTGAVSAFSKLQWKALVSGVLERKD